jgi:predicted XRE-type DNA-binding protein
MKKKLEYEEGSGNVFADIGVANPKEALAKAEVAYQISRIVKKKRLSQVKVAKILGIDQPKVSALLRGRLTNFSLERLFRFLNDLGQDIYITIVPATRAGRGHTRINDSANHSRIAALSK